MTPATHRIVTSASSAPHTPSHVTSVAAAGAEWCIADMSSEGVIMWADAVIAPIDDDPDVIAWMLAAPRISAETIRAAMITQRSARGITSMPPTLGGQPVRQLDSDAHDVVVAVVDRPNVDEIPVVAGVDEVAIAHIDTGVAGHDDDVTGQGIRRRDRRAGGPDTRR